MLVVNQLRNICPHSGEKKKTADGQRISCAFLYHWRYGGFEKSEPPFLFAFPTMLMQSRGRYIGGYRHVNFCHSYHPWAAPIKKSLAPPLGRYDYLSALSFQLKQKNYGYFCCASFPLCGAGAFCCRFFGKVPEVRRCRSPPPFDSPVNHPDRKSVV